MKITEFDWPLLKNTDFTWVWLGFSYFLFYIQLLQRARVRLTKELSYISDYE